MWHDKMSTICELEVEEAPFVGHLIAIIFYSNVREFQLHSLFFLSHSTPHQQSLRCCNFVRRLLSLRNHPPKVLQRTQSPPKGNALSFSSFFFNGNFKHTHFSLQLSGAAVEVQGSTWFNSPWRCNWHVVSSVDRWVRDKGDLSL